MKIVKSLLLAACAAAGLAGASPAAATTLYVYGYSAATDVLTLTGSAHDGSFQGAEGLWVSNTYFNSAADANSAGQLYSLPVFCVDLIHEIGGGYSPPLVYKSGPVNSNSLGALSGTPVGNLSSTTSSEIGWLAANGVSLIAAGADVLDIDGDWQQDVTAYQGAIWQVEYGGIATGGNADINDEIAALVAQAGNHEYDTYAYGLYSYNGQTRGFGDNQGFTTGGGVPEPAVWSMLILGFFGTGFMLRKSRDEQAFARA